MYSCRLSSLDIEMLKILHKQVNVVPVMAKADSFTLEEREAFKARVCRWKKT